MTNSRNLKSLSSFLSLPTDSTHILFSSFFFPPVTRFDSHMTGSTLLLFKWLPLFFLLSPFGSIQFYLPKRESPSSCSDVLFYSSLHSRKKRENRNQKFFYAFRHRLPSHRIYNTEMTRRSSVKQEKDSQEHFGLFIAIPHGC